MTSPHRHHPSAPDFVPVSTALLLPLCRDRRSAGGATVVRYRRSVTRPHGRHPDDLPPERRSAP